MSEVSSQRIWYDEELNATVTKCVVCGRTLMLLGNHEYGFYFECDCLHVVSNMASSKEVD